MRSVWCNSISPESFLMPFLRWFSSPLPSHLLPQATTHFYYDMLVFLFQNLMYISHMLCNSFVCGFFYSACFLDSPMLLLLLLSRFSHVQLCATPQTAAHQAPRPNSICMFSNSKFMSLGLTVPLISRFIHAIYLIYSFECQLRFKVNISQTESLILSIPWQNITPQRLLSQKTAPQSIQLLKPNNPLH